jgi:hypothetical protein
MGHMLHHQGLNLDEELLHAERSRDRASAGEHAAGEDAVDERDRGAVPPEQAVPGPDDERPPTAPGDEPGKR